MQDSTQFRINNFPLTIGQVIKDFDRLPADASLVCYHYTNRDGLQGILRDGGFRAKCRLNMNDPEEFS